MPAAQSKEMHCGAALSAEGSGSAVSGVGPIPGAEPKITPEDTSARAALPPLNGLGRILCFFALIALLAFALNATIDAGLRRIKTSKFGALNRIMSGQVNTDIIISGSSRALSHYDPRTIQNLTGRTAYNIGMNSSQIDFELAILKTYLSHNAKPRLVIQNLDLFSFETTKTGELYDPGYYMPYLHDQELYGFIRQVQPEAWRCRYIPLYGYAVEDMRFTWVWGILGCLGIQCSEDYYQGFNPRPAVWNDDFERFKAGNAKGVARTIEPKGVQCLEDLIALCRQQGIQVVLVYSPEYYEMQSLETNRKEIIAKFRQISGQFNVPFWDYSDSEFSMRRAYFNNSEHLNWDGAEAFSADLAGRLSQFLQAQAPAAGKPQSVARVDARAASVQP